MFRPPSLAPEQGKKAANRARMQALDSIALSSDGFVMPRNKERYRLLPQSPGLTE
jgi:hypothetical protein